MDGLSNLRTGHALIGWRIQLLDEVEEENHTCPLLEGNTEEDHELESGLEHLRIARRRAARRRFNDLKRSCVLCETFDSHENHKKVRTLERTMQWNDVNERTSTSQISFEKGVIVYCYIE